jgi:hypothetical protein
MRHLCHKTKRISDDEALSIVLQTCSKENAVSTTNPIVVNRSNSIEIINTNITINNNGDSIKSNNVEKIEENDEIEPWEKIEITLTGKTKIFNLLYANQLRRKLPKRLQMENLVMLHSILYNGSDLSSFYRNTMKVDYTIIIIQTVKGEILGGFNSTEWKKSETYCK